MFLLAVTFYGEKPGADKMVTFTFIWVALAIFVMDAIYTQRRNVQIKNKYILKKYADSCMRVGILPC